MLPLTKLVKRSQEDKNNYVEECVAKACARVSKTREATSEQGTDA